MLKKEIRKILLPLLALLLCGVIVFFERYGVIRKDVQGGEPSELTFTPALETETESLIVYDRDDASSTESMEMMTFVLDNMKIGYDTCQPEEFEAERLSHYRTVVIAMEDWELLGEKMFDLCLWVKNGGRMMNTMTPYPNRTFGAVSGKMGVTSGGTDYVPIHGVHIISESMIGAQEDAVYTLSEEDMYISLGVGLSDDAEVFLESDDGKVPLLWSYTSGEGRYVMMNEVLMDKYQRGFLCLAYSLLEDVCIYPVINGSAFYLDDFPSPVPEGNGEYIKRDYGVDIETFYSNIWWPKVLGLGEKYGIRYTGLVIEEYSDHIEGNFDRNLLTSQFLTFGNMLINSGGEIGFHGYNHMPLCLEGIDDEQQFGDYKLWKTEEDIEGALHELQDFCEELYPGLKFRVYVPPSNIISETGKTVLMRACPDIKVIASTYLADAESRVYEQEFAVDDAGIVHTPRVTSGCTMGAFERLTVLSELNFQLVQSHFMHPDDVLDVDRGAELGWEVLSRNLENYMDWIYTSAPEIRSMTGSELGAAVQQYCTLTVNRRYEDGVLTAKLGGFSGEAWFLMRVNEGEPEETTGCEIEKVTGNIYLVRATADEIQIAIKE